MTSKRGASRSTRSRPAGALRSMQMRPLAEVVAQEGGADAAALGVEHRGLRAAAEVAALGFSTLTTSAPSRARSWVA